MGRGHGRWLSEEVKAELWRRWKAGETLAHMSKAMGLYTNTLADAVKPHGGIAPKARIPPTAERGIGRCDRSHVTSRRTHHWRHWWLRSCGWTGLHSKYRFYPMEQIKDAVEDSLSGAVVKPVIVF